MTQEHVQLDREAYNCFVCLDLMKDPVTIPCGDSYCMDCIKRLWDERDEDEVYSCPLCKQTFTPRPILAKSNMLASLVKELENTGVKAVTVNSCYAGPEDTACDFCPGRKASKFCEQCQVCYCEKHLRAHMEVPPLKKHKLVEVQKKLRNICSHHSEVMNMFCRTDQEVICHICTVVEHKGHETISVAVERVERQGELEKNIQQKMQEREKDVELLQQEIQAIEISADKVVENSQMTFSGLIRLVEQRWSDVKQQVRSLQETEMLKVKQLQGEILLEINELKRREGELKKLSHMEDHHLFLSSYPSLLPIDGSAHSISISVHPLRHFDNIEATVLETRDKLLDVLNDKWKNISSALSEVDVLLNPKPKRAHFLNYSREITMDPNTAYRHMVLEGDRKVTRVRHAQEFCTHSSRFNDCNQVLSAERLTGRCYWEVKWSGGSYGVGVAVAYQTICRNGNLNECEFGRNENSWALVCNQRGGSYFLFNNHSTPVSGYSLFRIGVYLDHSAGILAFYNISETMTLLHRVQTTFTQPLYAGLHVNYGSTAEFSKLE